MKNRLALVALVVVLTLAARSAPAAGPTAANLRLVDFTSDRLSAFWGRPIVMKAAVFVPRRCMRAGVRCGVLYHLPGYGGSIAAAWSTVAVYARMSANSPRLAMAHVFLDPSFNGGYSYYTDSANDGPWDSALTQELIPYVEDRFGIGGVPESRFLVGHSSGGWTVMWLQVSNPDFFRAVWAISPDPLDFRHFYEVNATPGSGDNFYTDRAGRPRYLRRDHGVTMKRLMQTIDDDPAHGGIISSYEFAWSPRGPDGLPLRFFDRADGTLDQATLGAWQAFDVHTVLRDGGPTLRDALAGKINIYCGTQDDFFYNEPTSATCRFLRASHYRAVCRLVAGRTHGSIFFPSSLYPMGLEHLVLEQATGIWRRETARK